MLLSKPPQLVINHIAFLPVSLIRLKRGLDQGDAFASAAKTLLSFSLTCEEGMEGMDILEVIFRYLE